MNGIYYFSNYVKPDRVLISAARHIEKCMKCPYK